MYYRLITSQIRNARELVHLRRICERQNLKAQRATDAKHLDFGDIISQSRSSLSKGSKNSSFVFVYILPHAFP